MSTGVGETVGACVGDVVGDAVGESVGEPVGDMVGEIVGFAVGASVGDTVGDAVGAVVRASVSNTRTCPAELPLPSLPDAPPATRNPLPLSATACPNPSKAASPSISNPC